MRRVVLALLLLTLVGCNKSDATASGPAGSATVTAASLPSHADEEQKAKQEITKDNYVAELDKMAKEIDQP